jgi:hypothetical protein
VKKAEWRKQSRAAKSFPPPASCRAPSTLPRAFVTARPVLRFEVLSDLRGRPTPASGPPAHAGSERMISEGSEGRSKSRMSAPADAPVAHF